MGRSLSLISYLKLKYHDFTYSEENRPNIFSLMPLASVIYQRKKSCITFWYHDIYKVYALLKEIIVNFIHRIYFQC